MKADDVKQVRRELNMTQVELAAALGVSESTVQRWERGVVEVRKPYELAIETLVAFLLKAKRPSELDMIGIVSRLEMRNQIVELKQENERLKKENSALAKEHRRMTEWLTNEEKLKLLLNVR